MVEGPAFRRPRASRAPGFALAGLSALVTACAGSAPLLHPAQVLRPGVVRAAAGVQASLPVARATTDGAAAELASRVAPVGVGPVVAGRAGLTGDNEAGLTYAGRALRIDARHAFLRREWALSLGLGASALAAQRPNESGESVYGGALDVPVLAGWASQGDLYAVWFGPRFRGALYGGDVLPPGSLAGGGAGGQGNAPALVPLTATEFGGSFVLGVRAGFRYFHAALEVTAEAMHVTGSVGDLRGAFDRVALAPSGALSLTF